MKFIYKAKKGLNKIIEGRIEAADQDKAVAKIIADGLVPVLVQEESKYLAGKSGKKRPEWLRFSFAERITNKHIYTFTKKLRVLLKSQVSILDSLYILVGQVRNRRFEAVIQDIIESVKQGSSFSESLEEFSQYFSPLYINIVRAGEASGNLYYSLQQISKYLDNQRRISQKVKASLTYPAVMVTVGIATVIFIITFVVPRLKMLFEDVVEELPLVTEILLNISVFFSKYWVVLGILFLAFIVFLFYTRSARWQKKVLYSFKKRTPIVKNIIYNQSLGRFARGLSILLASGVSVLASLKTAIPLVDDYVGQKELEEAYKEILSGRGLEESLKNNCKFLPDIFIKMVAIGETSGKLDEVLAELADSYAEEVDAGTKIVTSLIEPLAILVVGGILGFIVIAVLLPIFEMSFFIQ